MKLPNKRVEQIKLMDALLTELGMSTEYRAKRRRDISAQQKWNSSNQQFVGAVSFALSAKCIPTRPGVYTYTHRPTDLCVYVGKSENLRNRIGKGISYAKTLIATGKPPKKTNYSAIDKMVEMDSNLTNWTVSYMETFSVGIAAEKETTIIHEDAPRFNSKGMAGK